MSSGSLLQGYDVVVCQACGFAFADRIPSQIHFDEYYQNMSKYDHQDHNDEESEYDLTRFRAVSDTLIPFLPNRTVRVLDVGCATGRLLSLFKEKGYSNVIGLDPSPACSRSAQRLHGVQVVIGTIYEVDEAMANEQPFDAIILTGVLEHLRDIEGALRRIRGLMKDGALIFIEVPDAVGFTRWPDAPFQEFSIEHINFFSKISLENLMRPHGFTQVFCCETPRHQTSSTVMPVISTVFRKQEEMLTTSRTHDRETECALKDYVLKSHEVESRINRKIDSLVETHEPVVVWGVGTHTLHLLSVSRLMQTNIRAFVDSNPNYQGKRLNGFPILAPSELRGRTETILISSRVFQRAIEKQIREELRLGNEIMRLYSV